MISSRITVSTTAVQIVAATANATRTVYVEADGNDVQLGGSAVTASTGLTVPNGSSMAVVLPPLNSLYAIVNTGTHAVLVLQPTGDF